MADLPSTLAQMKGRWMIGGSAAEAAPAPWKMAVAGDDAPDLAMLTIAAQAMQVALRPTPGSHPDLLPSLPHLALPVLPDAHRAAFRRVIDGTRMHEGFRDALLQFIAGRGYVVHPLDHMPRDSGKVPEVYAPWLDWKKSNTASPETTLTDDNWAHWRPADRAVALARIRRSDPSAARRLLETNASDLPAEARFRAVQVLAEGLSPDDADYLDTLTKDRSSKIQVFATQLLSRLGAPIESAEATAELSDFFATGKQGLLKRRVTVTPTKIKTDAQRRRRHVLMGQVSLTSLSQALGLRAEDLVVAWGGSDPALTQDFVEMVALTGNDAACGLLAKRCDRSDMLSPTRLAPLAARLAATDRKTLLPTILKAAETSLTGVQAWAQGMLGTLPAKVLTGTDAFKDLQTRAAPSKDGTAKPADPILDAGLFTLGLLLDRDGAEAVRTTFVRAGMSPADPALTLLALNAALTPSGDRP